MSCCRHAPAPEQTAVRLLGGSGSGAVSLVANGRCGPPTPVLHGRHEDGRAWIVADPSRLPGWEPVDYLRGGVAVTLGIVEQAPIADLCVTTAGLLGKGTAQLVPPGRESGAAPESSERVGELLEGWPEGRLYEVTLFEIVVQVGHRRVPVDPCIVAGTEPDPLARDQWSAVEQITMAHHRTLQVLTQRTEAQTGYQSGGGCVEPAEQVRLIGVDQRGATALCIRGGTGTRVRIPFRRPIHTVDEAIAELGDLL